MGTQSKNISENLRDTGLGLEYDGVPIVAGGGGGSTAIIESDLTAAYYIFDVPFVGAKTFTEEFPSGITTVKYDVASENGAWDDNSGNHRTLAELNTYAAARGASEHFTVAAVIIDAGTVFANKDEAILQLNYL